MQISKLTFTTIINSFFDALDFKIIIWQKMIIKRNFNILNFALNCDRLSSKHLRTTKSLFLAIRR
jgi:hypothetical protein